MHVSSSSSNEEVNPQPFFSIQEAKKLLLGKKVTLIKPQNLEWDERWKIAGISFSIFAFYIGAAAFFSAAQQFSTLDHDQDYLHPYLSWTDTYYDSKNFQDPFFSKNGSIILHSRDILVPNVSAGVITFIAVALIPPLLFFLTGKSYYFGINHFAKKEYLKQHRVNEQIDNLFIQLSTIEIQSYLPDENPIEVSAKFIKKMTKLDLLREEQFFFLSPLQQNAYKEVKAISLNGIFQEELLEVKIEEFEMEENEIELEEDRVPFNQIASFFKNKELILDFNQLKDILEEAKHYSSPQIDHLIVKSLIKKLNDLLDTFELESLLTICAKYKLDPVKKGIDIKVSFQLPDFFSDDFFKTVELIKIYDLRYSFEELVKTLTHSFEKLSLDERFVPILAKLFHLNKKFIKNLFPSFEELLQLKPKLLKNLFEESTKLESLPILKIICLFCKNPENSHITFANWNRPPTITLNTSKEKESDAS